tara:strand:+ start:81 stop:938 length:858 start_codon:yes stop_codon:yes gene_type:complete
MSCKPADITTDITNPCDLKCKLFTDYPSQGIKIIGLNNDTFNIPNVTDMSIEYNFEKYTVLKVFISSPSAQLYNGKRVDAELVIIHTSSSTPVMIVVPIVIGYSSSELDDIINKADKGVETEFNLNNFIPVNPFYSYTGVLKSGDICNNKDKFEIIVFQKRDALTLIAENMKLFKNTNNDNVKFALPDGESISYSKNIPLKKENDNEFPITCEPYDDTELEKEPEPKKFRSPFVMSEKEFSEWRSNVVLQIIIGAVVLYVLVKFLFLITSLGYKSNAVKNIIETD